MEKMKLEVTRKYYKLYPYEKSIWDKENRRNKGTCPKLDEKFYVNNYFNGHVSKKDLLGLYNRKEKAIYIPIGTDINFIQSKLYDYNIRYDIIKSNKVIEPRYVEFEIDEKFQYRDKVQEESVRFLTTKALFHCRMLALATGRGKTFCAIKALSLMNTPALIISETLGDQWIERIIEYTNFTCTIENKKIYYIKGVSNLHRLLNKSKHKGIFYITTSSTLDSYLDTYGRDSLNELCSILGIGITIFDEFHMRWVKNTKIDRYINTELTWYLTATPGRTEREEGRVFNLVMTKIPIYGSKTFNEEININLRLIDYNTNAKEHEINKCITYKGLSAILYWNYLFSKFDNIMYIMGIIRMIIDPFINKDPNCKILIYLSKLEHVDKFINMLEKVYENDVKFGNYTTKVSKKHKRLEIRKNIIFTTILSGGVGLDIKGLSTIISLVPYSSNITSVQMIGRLRNIQTKELYYYDLIDTSFETMNKQREKRLNIFMQKAKSIKKATITREQVKKYLVSKQ